MDIYINENLTGFDNIEPGVGIYQGSINSSCINIYFKKNIGANNYPVLNIQLPNGRKIGSLVPTQINVHDVEEYVQAYQYQFGTNDLLISGIASASITIIYTSNGDITAKKVIGTFNIKILNTSAITDYDVIYSDVSSGEKTILSLISQIEALSNAVTGQMPTSITDAEIENINSEV